MLRCTEHSGNILKAINFTGQSKSFKNQENQVITYSRKNKKNQG